MDYELDLRHYHCPLPLLMTQKALRKLAKGDRLIVQLNPLSSVADFEQLCQSKGYDLIRKHTFPTEIRLLIET